MTNCVIIPDDPNPMSSMVSIRHNDGFDSPSNNLGRIPNLARAGREQIHYILFYFLLLAG
jgi:hypothetical protein